MRCFFARSGNRGKKIKKLKLAIANCKNMCYNNREVSDG